MNKWTKLVPAVLSWGMVMAASAQEAESSAPVADQTSTEPAASIAADDAQAGAAVAPAESTTTESADSAPAPAVEPQADTASAPQDSSAPADAVADPAVAAAPETPAAETVATIPVEVVKAAAEPEPPAPADGVAHLDDIVVTATKRKQSVRNIPVSITALTGERLEELGAHELKDFIQLVPGVNTQDEIAGVAKKLSVRGVGPDTNTNQTVGIVLGDVPLSDPYGSYSIADPDPWDMRTIEVLKGPQGTLFGATSLAGLIRYQPNTPELGQWSGRLSADYTRVTQGGSEPTVSAALNVPIGDTIAVRASGSWQHKPGVIDIDTVGRHEKDADDSYTRTGRVMALWQPTERFAANLWYMQGDRKANELNYVTNPEGEFSRNDAPAPSPVDNGYALSTADLRYTFDWATLVSVTGYQTKTSFNDADSSYIVHPLAELGLHTVHVRRQVDTSGVLQELRLVSPDAGPWTWLVGGFYSTYTADITSRLYVYPGLAAVNNLLSLLPAGVLPIFESNLGIGTVTTGFHPVDAYEQALFGELSRKFGDSFTITVGGRYYRTGVEGTQASNTQGSDPLKQQDNGYSPKLSAMYRPDDNLMIYATLSRGFQYGGFNLPVVEPVPSTFKSATLWNHEIGVRTDWLDRTLRFDVTALYLRLTNPQVFEATSDQLGGFVGNVGASRSIGAETTLRYLTPLPGLSIEVAASYIKATTTQEFTDSSGNVVPVGSEMPSSPPLQTATTLAYAHGLGPWQLQTALIHSYQDKAWNDIQHDVQVGGYGLLHASLGVSRNDLPFTPSLTFSVNNLLDVDKMTSALGGPDTIAAAPGLSEALTTPRLRVFTQPRTFRLNLSASFE